MQLIVEDRTSRVNLGNRVKPGMIFKAADTNTMLIAASYVDDTELYLIDLSDGCIFSTDNIVEYNIGEVQKYIGATLVNATKVIVE